MWRIFQFYYKNSYLPSPVKSKTLGSHLSLSVLTFSISTILILIHIQQRHGRTSKENHHRHWSWHWCAFIFKLYLSLTMPPGPGMFINFPAFEVLILILLSNGHALDEYRIHICLTLLFNAINTLAGPVWLGRKVIQKKREGWIFGLSLILELK